MTHPSLRFLPVLSFGVLSLVVEACAPSPVGSGGADGPSAGKADGDGATLEAARQDGVRCGERIASLPAVDLEPAGKKGSEELTEAFADCLTAYTRLPTVNRPGADQKATEILAVRFLQGVFDVLGIPHRELEAIDPYGRTRVSLIGTLTPEGARAPMGEARSFDWTERDDGPSTILLHHTDVVAATAEKWEEGIDPFSGYRGPSEAADASDHAYVWGRGTLDMKGQGLLAVFTLGIIKAQSLDIGQPLHLLAVADEEQDGTGARGALDEMRPGGELAALTGAALVVNEGGFGYRDQIGQGSAIHAVATEEKGGAWLELTHDDQAVLFEMLAELKLFPQDRFGITGPDGEPPDDFEGRHWGCKLTRVTPVGELKVNVVPNAVEATLGCQREPDERTLRSVFANQNSDVEEFELTIDELGRTTRLRLDAKTSEHGSLAEGDGVLGALAGALYRMKAIDPRDDYGEPDFYELIRTPATQELVEFVRDYADELELSTLEEVALWEWVLDNIDFVEDIVLESLGARFASKRLFRTSCTWTGLEIGPEGSRALMDCRLVIPESADDFIDELREMAPTGGGEPVSVEAVATTWNFTESPVDHPFMGIVREELGRDLDRPGRPGVSEVTAYMMPAGTDNTFFRDPRSHLAPSGEPIARDGIPCYGFFPILTDRSLVNTQHGSDERYPVADMAPSTKRYARVVLRASQIEAN